MLTLEATVRMFSMTFPRVLPKHSFLVLLSFSQLSKISKHLKPTARKLEIRRHWSLLPKLTNSTMLSHLFCKIPLLNQQTICHSSQSFHFLTVWHPNISYRCERHFKVCWIQGAKSNQPSVLIACCKHMLSLSVGLRRGPAPDLQPKNRTQALSGIIIW